MVTASTKRAVLDGEFSRRVKDKELNVNITVDQSRSSWPLKWVLFYPTSHTYSMCTQGSFVLHHAGEQSAIYSAPWELLFSPLRLVGARLGGSRQERAGQGETAGSAETTRALGPEA